MSRVHSHIQTAADIIETYRGEEPLSAFLKKYFSQNKKFGSTDRKRISHLCYCYYRLGKACLELGLEDRIMLGLFMCSASPNEYLEVLKPSWNELVDLKVNEKSAPGLPGEPFKFSSADVFPWAAELSDSISTDDFIYSHFQQPDLFIRMRPGKNENVREKLSRAEISFRQVEEQSIAVPNQTKLEKVLELDRDAVIQDLSSQRTGNMLKFKVESGQGEVNTKVWDCCAGSGGKSIMVYDIFPRIELSVSDIRESILSNLKKRFEAAGIIDYKSFVLDLSRSGSTSKIHPESYGDSTFDLVIADLPCTGSGTWSRTPEQLFYFQPFKIEVYAAKQESILTNVIPFVKPGGYLFYITCSVFRKENEDRVKQIIKSGLVCVETKIFHGYNERADTMFAALFQKPIA